MLYTESICGYVKNIIVYTITRNYNTIFIDYWVHGTQWETYYCSLQRYKKIFPVNLKYQVKGMLLGRL